MAQEARSCFWERKWLGLRLGADSRRESRVSLDALHEQVVGHMGLPMRGAEECASLYALYTGGCSGGILAKLGAKVLMQGGGIEGARAQRLMS